MEDNFKKFVRLVERMRQAQKDYFRMRDSNALRISKQIEREVDLAIREYLNDGNKQGSLM